MKVRTFLSGHSGTSLQNPNLKFLSYSPKSQSFSSHFPLLKFSLFPSGKSLNLFIRRSQIQEVVGCNVEISSKSSCTGDGNVSSVSLAMVETVECEKEDNVVEVKREELVDQGVWGLMKEILMFTGPATGLWICGPLMSLTHTAIIGQGSSLELAALGPGTVLCDYMSYVFMFLSVATSNLVATALAGKDKNKVQHQISVLLFVGLASGCFMLFFTKFFGFWALTAFTGPRNAHIVPVANKYVQIRGLAWPAVIVGWVAQSASLGMKDSWGPLKALAVACVLNGIGDIVLCNVLGYGIAGAAWATVMSQVVAAYMMIEALNRKGFNAFAPSIPSPDDLLTIFRLSAPVFVMMMSKVSFYALMIYFATSMGTLTVAAHQVMNQTYSLLTVWGEPLCQAAQSFMPELMYGHNKSLPKARMLLKSLVIIGAILGLVLAVVGTSVLLLFPYIFTPDRSVIQEMHKVLIPYFIAIVVTPSALSVEGTLLAGRDLKFLGFSMSGCFSLGALVLLLVSNGTTFGLPGCWCALVGFQWARFFLSLQRLLSPDGILFSEDFSHYKLEKLKAA